MPPTEVLALARTGYATEPLQYALAHHGIPHRVLGSLGLYERSEVRDALAYLTLLQNPRDAQAFRRAIAVAQARRRPGDGARAGDVRARAPRRRSDRRASARQPRWIDCPSAGHGERLDEFGAGLRQCARS